MTSYFQQEQERMKAETAHEHHKIEFREMCEKMINDALQKHDQEVQVNVQTTLNGRPCTMNGLVADVKKQVYAVLQKAFKK